VNVPSIPIRTALAVALSVAASGCVSHQHVVGLGPTGTGSTSERQYYVLFGLLQVNEVDTQRFAPELTSYTIDTRFSFTDLVLSTLMLPLTVTTRTVTVRT
jgi:hypothetical protein